MKQLAFGALLVGLLVACGGDDTTIIKSDGSVVVPTTCNPLMQTGCGANEKCTWVVDLLPPPPGDPIGHLGCAPNGTVAVDGACKRQGPAGATGYDDCERGAVCSTLMSQPTTSGPPTGFCKALCDNQLGQPMCDTQHVCVTYSNLFDTGPDSPASAGVCDRKCDPLTENDYDGSGALTRSTSICGLDANGNPNGCYGSPSRGTAPATEWSCTRDYNYNSAQPIGLRHRVQCTSDTIIGSDSVPRVCLHSSGVPFTNSCNQGYLPVLRESSMVSTAICAAICKPLNCYLNNCGGTGTPNRLGAAPHRCNRLDRVGGSTFNSAESDPGGGEHCAYMWEFEIDPSGVYLPSASSDTLGICIDHGQYLYDSDGDGSADVIEPACSTLADPGLVSAAGRGAGYFACTDTTLAGIMAVNGKAQLREVLKLDRPRTLYHRTMRAD